MSTTPAEHRNQGTGAVITIDTPERITVLGQSIAEASKELSRLLNALESTADQQLLDAAQQFIIITEHPNLAPYNLAHKALSDAAVAASNIKDLAQYAVTLQLTCSRVGHVSDGTGRLSDVSDIERVCKRACL